MRRLPRMLTAERVPLRVARVVTVTAVIAFLAEAIFLFARHRPGAYAAASAALLMFVLAGLMEWMAVDARRRAREITPRPPLALPSAPHRRPSPRPRTSTNH